MGRARALLFDMDGVLVDTEPLKASAHASTVRTFGGISSESVYLTVMGQAQPEVRAEFLKESKISLDADEYDRIFQKIYADLIDQRLSVVPGVNNLMAALNRQGVLLALVSSSPRDLVEKILHKTGLFSHFVLLITGDDVVKKKPSSEPYLTALSRLSLPASSALAMEDTEAGIESATSAGIDVIAVRHSMNQAHDFSRAAAVLDSLQDTRAVLAAIQKGFALHRKSG